MTKILLTGLPGRRGPAGVYERQLGNVAILIPLIAELRKRLPDVSLDTTIQLTDEFCAAYGITSLPAERRHLSKFDGPFKLLRAAWAWLRARVGWLRSSYLAPWLDYDLILDFHGDQFPSDVHPIRVATHAFEIAALRHLSPHLPIIEFVSSPGPFETEFQRWVARFMYRHLTLFTNREPLSSELLKEIGFGKNTVNTACPAWLLQPADKARGEHLLRAEGINLDKRPLVGLTLCGYNLPSLRTWKKVSNWDDLQIYVPLLRYLLDTLDAHVFLLPHVYRFNPYTRSRELINGPDYDILWYLANLMGEHPRLHLIQGKYAAEEAKTMIGQCDLFISGRLHAAVAAMSQHVPTVLIAYGHKHHGFAQLIDHDAYVFDGDDSQALAALAERAWQERDAIRLKLAHNMPHVAQLVQLNFEIIEQILSMEPAQRSPITPEQMQIWAEQGA